MDKWTRTTAGLATAAAGLLLTTASVVFVSSDASAGTPAHGDSAAVAPGAASYGRAAPSGTTLRALARKAGIRVGTAVNSDALAGEAPYAQKVADEFSSVTPENVMKWDTVEPARGTYDFTQADQLVAFAKAHGQLVRGHNLLWHNQLPSWLTSGDFSAAELRDILHQHITAEVAHFKGEIWQWDVVNEAFNDDGTLRDDLWLDKLGPGYVADAFRWAHAADPKAVLFINDYNIEGVNAKSTALYDLVKGLRAEGVPVQGVGIQGHLDVKYPAPHDIADNMARFDALGVQTAITEADVRMTLPADATDVEAQDEAYQTLLQGCLLTRHCTDFTVWGFTDKYSWVPGVFTGEGQANIFDENYRPKSAYTALGQDLRLAGGR
ncbi:endo-1,4-beta-xylanase [Actinacidiphila rubida]|uniref:Beta-xylanase n=1 Tax=Actinacidiphila rubida TaxID=310780 RepID=A0A1H8N5K0_9ACTN|nr:endo-1,4-beta-xylanase [Actinacidiphila rubida]SEO24832.1 endo-1,4-beta-xylanase [Actinacidiphila rubida]